MKDLAIRHGDFDDGILKALVDARHQVVRFVFALRLRGELIARNVVTMIWRLCLHGLRDCLQGLIARRMAADIIDCFQTVTVGTHLDGKLL